MNPILPKNIIRKKTSLGIFIRKLKLLPINQSPSPHPTPAPPKKSSSTQWPNTKKIAKEFISSHTLTYDYVVAVWCFGDAPFCCWIRWANVGISNFWLIIPFLNSTFCYCVSSKKIWCSPKMLLSSNSNMKSTLCAIHARGPTQKKLLLGAFIHSFQSPCSLYKCTPHHRDITQHLSWHHQHPR